MSKDEKRGGDAPFHPQNELDQVTGTIWSQHPGVSKREWFAGMAMIGLLSSNASYIQRPEELASHAHCMADAMIKEGEQT